MKKFLSSAIVATIVLGAPLAHAEWGSIPDPNELWLAQLPVLAERLGLAKRQECKGILKTNHDGDLSFDVPPEGVCEINKSETAKVLAQCTPGHFCRVYGVVEDCKDSGECSEMTEVLQVRRK